MAIDLHDLSENEIFPVAGVRLGTAEAAIKRPGRHDLLIIELAIETTGAAVFTRNAFCAAPVIVAREHLAKTNPRFWLINSGNANAGTGGQGLADAHETCAELAHLAGCAPEQIMPFSTGVIGTRLPIARIKAVLPAALGVLSETGWISAAQAIMTTDTVAKGASRRVMVGNTLLTVTGIAKGSGMIRPDLATMLAFIATDANVSRPLLTRCLTEAVEESFNRITVDGDTSTNDACVLAATGQGKVVVDQTAGPSWEALRRAVGEVCRTLALAIVRDGEGATRFITIAVTGGADQAECLAVAYTVAHSPLVKTALFAGDPNWGRILAAVGRSNLSMLDVKGVDIHLNEVRIVHSGEPDPEYREAAGAAILSRPEYTLHIGLGRGTARIEIWTCDLSYDYVRINAEYRT
ncbi:Glutamate N-acetyltransferase / Amino-acid acetyltransferase [Gammaproteobacteria bacterium]